MKTKITVKTMLLAAVIFAAGTANAQVVYKGLRVPQMSTSDRTSIGAEANPANAKGQQIFNLSTGKMEYWNGLRWVSDTLKASAGNGLQVYSNGIDSVYYALPAGTTSGQVLKWNGTDAWTAGADNNSEYTAGTGLTLSNTQFSLDQSVVASQIHDSLANVINTKVDTIANRGGMTIDKSDDKNYKVGLVSGTAANQIMKWNNTDSKWELTTIDALVKSVNVNTDTTITINSHLFYGEITISDANTKIVSITPNITGNADFIAENFDISVSARVAGSNKIVWTLRVKNDNINSTSSATINGVSINYIGTDNLANTTAFTTKTFIGQ
jgi:hypothetical protein